MTISQMLKWMYSLGSTSALIGAIMLTLTIIISLFIKSEKFSKIEKIVRNCSYALIITGIIILCGVTLKVIGLILE